MRSRFIVDATHFEKLFPFSFVTTIDGKFTRIGPSLKKLYPQLKVDLDITPYFKFLKPNSVSFEQLIKNNDEGMVILEDSSGQFQLMGQIINSVRNNLCIFVVNLFINDVHKLNRLNLTFNDFAVQDQVFDFLMLLQTHQQAIKEADIINKKLAEAIQIATNASALKSQFLANMSHELRTPMNGVLGMASVLIETELTPDQKDYVESIITSGESMLNLINDILDLSKIEAGFIHLDIAKLRINEIFEDVTETVKVAAQKKSLSLNTYVDPAIPKYMMGDFLRLKQVVLNFVGNAIKFTASGYVNINAILQKNENNKYQIFFSVEDSGIGMNSATLDKIFNPFVQGDSSTTKKFGGTGLGLSISKKLIEAMNGEIGVKSEVGKGTMFWFTVELEEAAQIQAA